LYFSRAIDAIPAQANGAQAPVGDREPARRRWSRLAAARAEHASEAVQRFRPVAAGRGDREVERRIGGGLADRLAPRALVERAVADLDELDDRREITGRLRACRRREPFQPDDDEVDLGRRGQHPRARQRSSAQGAWCVRVLAPGLGARRFGSPHGSRRPSRQHDLAEPVPLRESAAPFAIGACQDHGRRPGACSCPRSSHGSRARLRRDGCCDDRGRAPDLRRRIHLCPCPDPRLRRRRRHGEHRGYDGQRQEAAKALGGGSPHDVPSSTRRRGSAIVSSREAGT
jgi:hypothetical protein